MRRACACKHKDRPSGTETAQQDAPDFLLQTQNRPRTPLPFIPQGSIYSSMAFAMFVGGLNLPMRKPQSDQA